MVLGAQLAYSYVRDLSVVYSAINIFQLQQFVYLFITKIDIYRQSKDVEGDVLSILDMVMPMFTSLVC